MSHTTPIRLPGSHNHSTLCASVKDTNQALAAPRLDRKYRVAEFLPHGGRLCSLAFPSDFVFQVCDPFDTLRSARSRTRAGYDKLGGGMGFEFSGLNDRGCTHVRRR